MRMSKWVFDSKEFEDKQPGMMFSRHFDISESSFPQFQQIYECGNETKMHQFLETHPAYLSFALLYTGHHGFWSKTKPQLRPSLINRKKGHIPDFLICGDSSHGMNWFVIELKGPQDTLFNKVGAALSPKANEGITQLVDYVDYINSNIPTLRTTLQIPNLEQVKGILLLGKEDETEEDDVKKELKRAWNRALKEIELVSYSRILRFAQSHFASMQK